MSTCTIPNCTERALSKKKCILHCDKGYFLHEASNHYLEEFFQKLSDYIYKQLEKKLLALQTSMEKEKRISKNKPIYEDVTPELLKQYIELKVEISVLPSLKSFLLNEVKIEFYEISFPQIYSYSKDYLLLFRNIPIIEFHRCEFWLTSLINSNNYTYIECQFKWYWYLSGNLYSEKAQYQSCCFFMDVSFGNNYSNTVVERTFFQNCDFKKKLYLVNAVFTDKLFKDNGIKNNTLHQLQLDNCTFDQKFYLNNYEIHEFKAINTIFNKKFEFKNSKVLQSFELNNCNFEELFDLHNSMFQNFEIKRSIFSNLAIFEECVFGVNPNQYAIVANFEYVTFEGIANFRYTKFNSGLNIEKINSEKSINFLNCHIDYMNSNRETFRIVKNSFDNIGNYIEANKFYVLEMKKYKDEVIKEGSFWDKFILYFNYLTSNFGSSYLRPILWMFFLSLLYFIFREGYQQNWLYQVYTPANTFIFNISNFFNNLAISLKIPLLPHKFSLDEGTEFLNLILYILNASLLWLTIIALKRRTKR